MKYSFEWKILYMHDRSLVALAQRSSVIGEWETTLANELNEALSLANEKLH
jgi:hypothetical protein